MSTITVTCASAGCPNQGIPYVVPEDGFPVTCGGCDTILAAAATAN